MNRLSRYGPENRFSCVRGRGEVSLPVGCGVRLRLSVPQGRARGSGRLRSPSALYPVETYISVHSVEGLAAGLYHFDVEHFALDRLTDQDKAEDVAQACLNQTFMSQAAAVFLWTGVFRRAMSKYGDRGMRYILLDAGHICQNVMIAAEAVDCGGCPVGAFYDSELNQLLQIDGEEESILYAASVGRKFLKAT